MLNMLLNQITVTALADPVAETPLEQEIVVGPATKILTKPVMTADQATAIFTDPVMTADQATVIFTGPVMTADQATAIFTVPAMTADQAMAVRQILTSEETVEGTVDRAAMIHQILTLVETAEGTAVAMGAMIDKIQVYKSISIEAQITRWT